MQQDRPAAPSQAIRKTKSCDRGRALRTLRLCLFLLVVFPSHFGFAEPQDERRIEEGKRHDLRSTEVRRPEPPPAPPPMNDADSFYLAEMALRKVTYRYDLCKALVLLRGVENRYIDLNSQVAYLKQEGLLPERLEDEFDPMLPLRKGLTAYILRNALNIKGGLFLHLFRSSERFALSELVYKGIMSAGNTNDLVSGDELSSIITRTANHIAKHDN